MKRTVLLHWIVALTVALGIMLVPRTVGALDGDRAGGRFVYAVYATCGFGFTSINVLNPGAHVVQVTKTGTPLQAGQVPTPPSEAHHESLQPHWAFLMNCDDIASLTGGTRFGDSNVVIESDRELEVWAVYTVLVAGGGVGDTRLVHIDGSRSNR